MAGEEGGPGRHYDTVDRVESLGFGSGYGREGYGRGGRGFDGNDRGFHGYDWGSRRGRGFHGGGGRGFQGGGGRGFHGYDRECDGRQLRGTIASISRGNDCNFRGIGSNSRGNAWNSRGIASYFRGNATNSRGIASNFRGNANNLRDNASNFRGNANNLRGNASNFRGNASNFRGIASNFRGNANNFRGNASNFRGMASNSRGSASNSYRATDSYTRGSHSNYRDIASNCRGEARNSRSNGSNSSNYMGSASNYRGEASNYRNHRGSASSSRENASHSRGSADYVDSKSKGVKETGEVDEDSSRMANTMESFEYALPQLPVEHWIQVLEKVSLKHLGFVALTSRHMNSIAITPDLWTRTEVSKEKVKKRGLSQFFKINRFKKIKQIDFSFMVLSKKEGMRLLNDIPGSPLQKVDFRSTYLHKVPAVALSKPVAHLKMVNLRNTRLTSNQLIKVLEAILSSDLLKDVSLANNDLHGVPIELLCRAVCRLQKVNLAFTRLNAGQCARLVEAILSSESLLDVTLWRNNLSEVSADLLARAVGRLQRVDLSWTELTADQSTKVVEAIVSSNSLEIVSLLGTDLSHVPAHLMARVDGRLQH